MEAIRAADVIPTLDRQFANSIGIPEILSDNFPQFANAELKEFARKQGLVHTTQPAVDLLNDVFQKSH